MSLNMHTEERELFGIIAEFNDPEDLVQVARITREAGYRKVDTYTPFPVHGLFETLGFERNWLPYIVLLGAILGGGGGFLFQYYGNAVSYPINVAGRPPNSWPAFLIITFEMAVLGSAIFGVLGMLALNKLPMPYHPVFNTPHFELASRDRFFLCILGTDPQFEPEKTQQFLEDVDPKPQMVFEVEQGATKIYE